MAVNFPFDANDIGILDISGGVAIYIKGRLHAVLLGEYEKGFCRLATQNSNFAFPLDQSPVMPRQEYAVPLQVEFKSQAYDAAVTIYQDDASCTAFLRSCQGDGRTWLYNTSPDMNIFGISRRSFSANDSIPLPWDLALHLNVNPAEEESDLSCHFNRSGKEIVSAIKLRGKIIGALVSGDMTGWSVFANCDNMLARKYEP